MSADYRPNTAEVTRDALLRLNGMTCPVRVYDEIVHANWAMTVENIVKDAVERGWAK